MCGGSGKLHISYTKESVERQGDKPAYLVRPDHPDFKLGSRARRFADREAERLGINLKHNPTEAPDVLLFVTDTGPTRHHKGPFEDRLAHLLSHLFPAGERREGTVLDSLQMAAFATT